MAQKRLFSLQIVDSDAFLDMPVSSQLLYFHLCMRADDEGFIGNPKRIMRIIGVADDDIKVLLSKRFILPFETGVVVIKHWLIHNTIRMDRFNPTAYQDEKATLYLKDNKSYTDRQPNGNQMATQVKLSKVNLIKDNKYTSIEKVEKELDDLQDKFKTKSVYKEFEQAKDWLASSGKHYKNYLAFFRNWLRRSKDERVPAKVWTPPKVEEINEAGLARVEQAKKEIARNLAKI